MPLGSLVQGMFNLAGGALNDWSQAQQNELDYQRQKEFAQNSMQWKAEDARKAGFHPLAALGTLSANYTPSASAGGGIGDALMNTGQAVGRGVSRALDPETKMNRRLMALQLRQEELKTKALEDSLKKMGQAPQPTKAGAGTVKNSVIPKKTAGTKSSAMIQASKPMYQLFTSDSRPGSRVFKIGATQEYADSADATPLAAFDIFLSKHFNRDAVFSAIKSQLPKAKDGYEWQIYRGVAGWQVEEIPKKSSSSKAAPAPTGRKYYHEKFYN